MQFLRKTTFSLRALGLFSAALLSWQANAQTAGGEEPASARPSRERDDRAHHEGARHPGAGRRRHERRKAVLLQLRRRLKGERAEGFRENDLRDRLGQQDTHRDSRSLRRDGRLPVALRQGEHASAGARRQQLRPDQPPRSRDLHAGRSAFAVSRRGHGPGHDGRLLPGLASGLRPGDPSRLLEPEHRPLRASRCEEHGRILPRDHAGQALPDARVAAHLHQGSPRADERLCLRLLERGQAHPGESGRSGRGSVWGEDHVGRHDPLRRGEHRRGEARRYAAAGDRRDTYRVSQGRRHDAGPGMGDVPLPDGPRATSCRQLDRDQPEAQQVGEARAADAA